MNALHSPVLMLTLCVWQDSWGLCNHCTISTKGGKSQVKRVLRECTKWSLNATKKKTAVKGFQREGNRAPNLTAVPLWKSKLNKSKNQQIRPDMDLLRLNSWEVKCQGLRRSEHHSKVRLQITPQSQETANFCGATLAGAPWQTRAEGGT